MFADGLVNADSENDYLMLVGKYGNYYTDRLTAKTTKQIVTGLSAAGNYEAGQDIYSKVYAAIKPGDALLFRTTNIHYKKASFDFLGAQNAYKVMKDSTTYYGANTYKTSSSSKPIFITFDNASAMADELHRKGYEIPYGQADVGDLVFYRADSNVNSDGTFTIMECTNAYTANIGKCGISTASGVTTFGLVRGSNLNYRVEMCARHPAAYGHGGNVPSKFTPYRRG